MIVVKRNKLLDKVIFNVLVSKSKFAKKLFNIKKSETHAIRRQPYPKGFTGYRLLKRSMPGNTMGAYPGEVGKMVRYRFLELKWHWFFKTDYRPGRPMVLWGAGKKGKQIAHRLQAQSIPFRWVCNTPSKWGHQMFGVPFEPTEVVQTLAAPVIIVAVGKPGDQQQIIDYLRRMDWQEGREFFRFA